MTAEGAPMRELTLPAADTASARRCLGSALARLARDVSAISIRGPSAAHRDDAQRVLARLAPLSRRMPGLVWSALRRPSVYVHLRLAADGADETGERLHVGLATLAVELACAGGLDAPLVLHRPPSRIVVRSSATELEIDHTRAVTIAPDGCVRQDDAACLARRSHVPLSPAIALALTDDNPLASLEAHPDKSGNALSLGGASVEQWTRALVDALARIERGLPLVREELELVLSQIVPVGTDDEKHLSASYREALGTIYVSLHPDPLTMTEALLHEAQHNKLNAVLTIDPLLENAPDERYASPVRPDPRPLLGVLLAVHAFVPVATLYASLRDAGALDAGEDARARARAPAIVRGNGEGLAMLEAHGRPTAAGRELLCELRELHERSLERLRRT